jgi:gliding motility-associated-like protein
MPVIGSPGTYELVVEDMTNQCRDSLSVMVMDTITTINAIASVGGDIDCDTPEVTLSAAGSTTGNDILYCWSGPDNAFTNDSTGLDVLVNSPGMYELIAKDTFTMCADTTVVEVLQDVLVPMIDISTPPTLSCSNPQDTIFSVVDNANPVAYNWSGPCLISSPDSSFVIVNCSGDYTLEVVDLVNGCSVSTAVTIQVDSVAPLIDIALPGVLNCAIDTVRIDATGSSTGPDVAIAWAVADGGNIVADVNTLEPVVDAAGTYTLTLTNLTNGCATTASTTVLDTITTLFADGGLGGLLTCDTETLVLDGENSTVNSNTVFQWFTSNGNILTDTTATSVTVSASGNYELVVRDTFTQCADTAFINVFQDTVLPTITLQDGFTINCATSIGTLSGAGSAAGPNITYNWSGPCILGPTDELQITADCAGIYYFEVENAVTGCVAMDSVEVIENLFVPTAAILPPPLLTCIDTSILLDGSNSSVGDAFVYTWAGPGLLNGETGLMPEVNAPGSYTLIVRDTISACTDTTTTIVEEYINQPIADAGLPQVITCLEDTVQIGGSNTSIGDEIVYDWFTAEGNIVSGGEAALAFVDAAGVYVFFVTDTLSGCADTSFVTTTIDQMPPGVNAGFDVEIDCASPEVMLSATSNTPLSFLEVSWSGDCILTDPTLLDITVDCPDEYIVQVTDTRNGCFRLDTVLVQFDSLAPIASLPDSTFLDCELGTALLDGTASTSGFYQWIFDGTPIMGSTATLTVDQPGAYQLVVSNLDMTCSDTAQTEVVIDCAAIAVVAPPDTLDCVTSFVVLDGSASDGGQEVEYFWETATPGCITDGQGTPMITVNCSGFYSLIVTNTAIPVSDTVTVFVPIDTIAPIAHAGLPDTLTCIEPFAVLDGSGSSQGPAFMYEWTRSLFEVVSTELLDTVFQSGNYSLEVTDITNGCSAQDGIVIFNSIVEPQVAFSTAIFPCNLDTFEIQTVVNPPGVNYAFSWMGPGIVEGESEPAVFIDTAGIYTVSVLDTLNQCGITDSIEVIEQVCITCIDFLPPDTLTCLTDTVVIDASYCSPCEGCTLVWDTDGGLILDGQGTLSIVAGASGIYNLEVTDTLGLSSIFSVEVVADTLVPTADAGPDQVLTCTDTMVPLGGPDTSLGDEFIYSWASVLGNAVAPDDEANTMANAPDTYILTVENEMNGCTATDTVVVTQEVAFPFSEAGPDQAITCDQSLIILDGTNSQTGNAIVYEWTGPAGAAISGTTTLNPIVSDPGLYFLAVRDTSNGCVTTDSVTVALLTTPPDLPSVDVPDFTCVDTILSLDAMLTDTIGLTFSWCRLDDFDMPVECFDTDSVSVTMPGRWQFEMSIDSTGCSDTVLITVGTDTLPPIVDAGVPDTLFCTTDSLFLNGVVDAGGDSFELAWTGPEDAHITDSLTLMPAIFEPGSYLLEVTNQVNGCTAIDSVRIFGDENVPIIEAGPDTLVTCAQPSLTLAGSATTTSGQVIPMWSSQTGAIVGGGNSLFPTVEGAGWYVLVVIDPVSSCAAIDSLFVAADTIAPVANLDSPDGQLLTCDIDEIRLSADGSATVSGNALSYTWEVVNDGNIIPTGQDSVILVDTEGNYQLVVTDAVNGCTDVITFAIDSDVTEPLVVIAAPETITCAQDTITINAVGSSLGPDFDIEWTGPNGALSDTTLTPAITQSGDYTLTILNRVNGCSAVGQVVVPIDTVAPVALIGIPDVLDCTTLFTALDGSASTQGPEIAYEWAGPVTGSNMTPVTTTDAPGVYTLTVRNERNGCIGENTVEVIQTEAPITAVELTITPPTCFGDTDARLMIDSVIGGTAPFLIGLNDEPFRFNQTFTDLAPGAYTVMIEDANGCQWQEAVVINAPEELVVDLGADIEEVLLGDSTRLEAMVNGTFDTLYWAPDSAFVDPSDPVQVVSPLETAYYSVTVINENGCVATDQLVLFMTKERSVFVPNVFSPNGDGNNDVFMIFAGPDVRQIRSFKIFDRWGNWVFGRERFQPNDPTYGWDGLFNGTEMNAAVYVFYAEVEFIDGWVEVIKGDVILMR